MRAERLADQGFLGRAVHFADTDCGDHHARGNRLVRHGDDGRGIAAATAAAGCRRRGVIVCRAVLVPMIVSVVTIMVMIVVMILPVVPM
ncbi:hypothetical protein GCM10027202_35450 [Microvirgula curvata]